MNRSPQSRVVERAQGIIAGDIGVIQGARELCGLRSAVTADDLDEDFLPFIAIDSETDTLPVGELRKLWNGEALKRKDQEIEAAERMYRKTAVEACRKLVTRYGGASNKPLQATRAASLLEQRETPRRGPRG